MKEITQQILTGERALYDTHDAKISYCTFENGESPLKESSNLEIDNCLFKWKYPFWYTDNVKVTRSAFFDMARAGIWYVNDFTMEDTIVEAPKNFRRVDGLVLKNVNIPNAAETLWNCRNVKMEKVTACGDYFAMNSTEMEIDGLVLDGNYSFDGGRNIVVRNSRLLSKDAFWNADKAVHFFCFGGLCFWISFACRTKTISRIWIPVFITSFYGFIDEIHQSFVPGRSCSVFDWIADTSGAIFGAVLFVFMAAKLSKAKK